MTSFLFRCLFSLSLFGLSYSAYAQQLSLDKFIQTILENNPGVQKILVNNEVAAGELEASQGINDAILSSSLTLVHSEPNEIIGFEASKSDDTQLKVSYDRLFSSSGRRLSLALSDQHTNRDPALTVGSQYYQPSFTLRLTQPLLKNTGGIQDRLNIDLKQLNLKLTKLNNKESLESYITQLALLYIDWYLALRELDISKEVHQQSIQQEKLTRTKVRRQVVEPYELLRAQETREDYYSRWQQAKGRYAGLTRKIQYQMNLDNGSTSSQQLAPDDPKSAKLLTSKQGEIRHPDYLSTTSRLKDILDTLKTQQNIILDARRNAQDPDLNLSVGYTRHGISDNFNNAHTSDLDRDDYSVMLEYKYPLGNRQAKGNYQTQIANKKQVEADVKQRLIDAQANLSNLQEQASQLFIALESTDRKINYATRKLIKEKQLFKIGELDLFELLRDQTTQLESRLNREKLYTQLLTLRLNIGELLDRNLDSYLLNTTNDNNNE